MNNDERKIVKDLLNACSKKVDSNLAFVEQVKSITEKMKMLLSALAQNIAIDDPELVQMIKESVVIEEKPPIVFSKGYTPWLDTERPNIKWNYYERYEEYLVKVKEWNWGTVSSVNASTDTILDHMQNPRSSSFFGTKGLVIGDIQSGKTANYTALINKALDCGYKLIIVLAGLTKDLRSQTQKRLDKEVLGYETRSDSQKGNAIGVGLLRGQVPSINAITHSGDSGDLKKSTAEAISTTLSDGMTPLIAVLKKNSSVLNALINNVLSSEVGSKTNGKFDIPVLIIDDEVDQASVNTKKNERVEEASTINRLIRTMLSKFNRYAYVGYTATPFANVFVNPYGFENEEDKDIFPEDFIICLTRPNDYCGVQEYFGIEPLSDYDDDALTLDLVEKIDDYFELFDDEIQVSKKILVDTPVVAINDSLNRAFMHFIIASAVKYSRGIIGHNSMLIHIARFKNPATSMRDLVYETISNMLVLYKYGDQEERDRFRIYWEKNIKGVSQSRLENEFCDTWESIEQHIITILEMTKNGIKIVNGDSGDICDFDSSNVGQHIIIGGDKLSRGLTLEGLLVSYYHRKSRTYDALLQMGRWFGYRKGWLDLCRIFTVNEYVNDFINAGIALELFKNDVEEMNDGGLTPIEFGLKIKYSPRLAPTSSTKMRNAQKQKISLSDGLQQTLTYDKNYVSKNRELVIDFVNNNDSFQGKSGNIIIRNISGEKIKDFLKQYKEKESGGTVSIRNWINYIDKLNDKGELIDWTVIVHSNSSANADTLDNIGYYKIYKSQYADRNLTAKDEDQDIYLKAIVDQSDFRDFYDEDSTEYNSVHKFVKTNETIQQTFTADKGVLAIYVMDIHKKIYSNTKILDTGKARKIYAKGDMLAGGEGVIGLCVWFPKTENYEQSAIEYYFNPVYLKSMQDVDEEE